ncbi:MAG: radical SAM protein [Candidatus Gracilibacteria bacterium]|nr:radical SAM protein [Candidatus Gracilibacteria bacterium]
MKKELIEKIKSSNNQFLKKDLLSLYLKKQIFFKNILSNINFLGVKNEDESNLSKIIDSLKGRKDIFIDENSKDIYYKTRSVGCTYCTLGQGCTVVLSYKCHRDCFFCYEETPLTPKVIIDPYDKKDMDNIYKIIDDSFSNPANKTLAVTGGEPLLFIDKIYEIFEYINEKYPGKHKRIYTTGEFLNDEKLQKLKDLGLDELRFSIKPGEEPNIALYKMAKKYVKHVLIEMPIMPYTKDYMIDILTKIDNEKCIDGINLNELTFNNLNKEKYKQNNLFLDLPSDEKEIYHRYYDISKIEIGVYGSKLLALELIDYFSNKNASFFMHYCDLDTVSNHHFLYKKANAKNKKINFSQITKYGLHKILRVYGNIAELEKILKENNIFSYYKTNSYIDLEPNMHNLFKNNDRAIIYKNYDYSYDVDFELLY